MYFRRAPFVGVRIVRVIISTINSTIDVYVVVKTRQTINGACLTRDEKFTRYDRIQFDSSILHRNPHDGRRKKNVMDYIHSFLFWYRYPSLRTAFKYGTFIWALRLNKIKLLGKKANVRNTRYENRCNRNFLHPNIPLYQRINTREKKTNGKNTITTIKWFVLLLNQPEGPLFISQSGNLQPTPPKGN